MRILHRIAGEASNARTRPRCTVNMPCLGLYTCSCYSSGTRRRPRSTEGQFRSNKRNRYGPRVGCQLVYQSVPQTYRLRASKVTMSTDALSTCSGGVGASISFRWPLHHGHRLWIGEPLVSRMLETPRPLLQGVSRIYRQGREGLFRALKPNTHAKLRGKINRSRVD